MRHAGTSHRSRPLAAAFARQRRAGLAAAWRWGALLLLMLALSLRALAGTAVPEAPPGMVAICTGGKIVYVDAVVLTLPPELASAVVEDAAADPPEGTPAPFPCPPVVAAADLGPAPPAAAAARVAQHFAAPAPARPAAVPADGVARAHRPRAPPTADPDTV